jgi:hypothetical protein
MKLHNLIFGIALIITVISVSMSLSVNVPFEADLSFADGFQTITDADGKRWDVQFEYTTNSTFTGVVRHTSRWREADVPFMSHDILVTTGEFADPDLVRTSVSNHHFLWRSQNQKPDGTINLLHIFPANEEIFNQLLDIETWDTVTITGREILRINRFDANGNDLGYWKDAGCNSILVTSVTIAP